MTKSGKGMSRPAGNYSLFEGRVIPFSPSMKANGEQVDDRIVEVCWDPVGEHWRMMRYRDDKPQGNHRSVVENVIQSIADGVEKDAVGAVIVCCVVAVI